jgi:hypothetical protein
MTSPSDPSPAGARERTLTWEQKLAACQALAECSLKMRKPGDWYVSTSVETIERGHEGMLVGRYGNGPTPEAAVEDHWRQITADDVKALVVRAMYPDRRKVRWNGFMWWDAV